MRNRVAPIALASLALVSQGCAPEPAEDVGVARQAALNANALNANALNANALNASALSPGALSAGPLSPDQMSGAAMDAIEDPGANGDLSRELLLYTVSCAFSTRQSFPFSWTDTSGALHDEDYPGLLGLAPCWAEQALDPTGQAWVSDCLGSRVNARGVSVMLSSRGTSPALAVTPDELSEYQTREAAFFGNLFASPFRVYACYDPLSLIPSQMQNRVCAEPPVLDAVNGYDCGPITVLGPCEQVLGLVTVGFCSSQDPVERYFYGCAPWAGAPAIPSITTFLAGSIPW